MLSNPLVSIVIPVYNGSNYLNEAIDSALTQTYRNIEIIVVNDGSTDNGATKDIALSYGDQIRYFEKANGGVASALNLGIQQMKGEYFSWLSHDDLYYPNKIEDQIGATGGNKNVIFYSDFDLINQDGEIISLSELPEVKPKHFRYWLTLESRLHGCTLLIPKKAFLDHGLFREDMLTTQDYDLWYRFSLTYNFIRLPKILVSSRQHRNQATKRMHETVLLECNNLHFHFFSHLESSNIPEPQTSSRIKLAKSFYKRGFYRAAFLTFSSIIEKKPNFHHLLLCYYYKIISNTRM